MALQYLLRYAQEQTKGRLESDPWMEQILLKTLDRSEINIQEAFEFSIKSQVKIAGACLHAYKKGDRVKLGNTPVVPNATR